MIDLTIIPARGNSKRIPHKNKKLINGKPLLKYTVEAAFDSIYTTNIVVSTEDREIIELCHVWAVELNSSDKKLWVYKRDPKLSMDHVQVSEVTLDVLRWWEYMAGKRMHPDSVILSLSPTSPFRTGKEIDEAFDYHIEYNQNKGCTVSAYQSTGYHWLNDAPMGHNPTMRWGMQDHKDHFPIVYRENGSIYLVNGWVYSMNTVLRSAPYSIFKSSDTVDVDWPEDLELVRKLMSEKCI